MYDISPTHFQSKHLQQISGVNGIVYWMGTFIWDMLNYTVCIVVITILFLIFNLEGLRGTALGAVFLLLVSSSGILNITCGETFISLMLITWKTF